jgi:hypothetical protein
VSEFDFSVSPVVPAGPILYAKREASTGAAMIGLIIFITVPVLAAALLCGRFTAKCAAERGRSQRAWFILGTLFFPLFPIQWMVLGLLPKK